ncbi:MAG: hypothetical protein K2N72_08795 [Oscillospiraceae bacterium]|nr:hypothetical protein [Oscillospiraceae bacterium]
MGELHEKNLNEENLRDEDDLVFLSFDEYEKIIGEAPYFTITHKITRECDRDFQKFANRRYGLKSLIVWAAFEFIEILLAISLYGGSMWWIFGLAAVLMPAAYIVGMVKRARSNREKEGKENVYLFYENYFVDRFDGNDLKINYDCCEVYETNKYFYIMILMVNTYTGFIVGKNDPGNDTEHFGGFLKEKFGENFKSERF